MTTLKDYERAHALRPIWIGDKANVQVFHTRRRNTWRERIAIVVCQAVIPFALVLGGLLALGLVFSGLYLLLAVGHEMIRRGGW